MMLIIGGALTAAIGMMASSTGVLVIGCILIIGGLVMMALDEEEYMR